MNFDIMQGAYVALLPSVIIILAMIFDWLCGDMRWFFKFIWHPVVFMGKLISFLDKRLNRGNRSDSNRIIRGTIVVIFTVGLSSLTGYLIVWALQDIAFAWAIEAFVASVLLAGRSLYQHVRKVGISLSENGLEGGREAVSHIVGRNPKMLDKHGVVRASVETLAENFSDGLVAPIFWYLLLGLPGLFAYKAINTLDSMIGYKTERHKAFGMIAAKLDDVANWIPARLTGILLAIAAIFTPGANPFRALDTMWKFASLHASPNAGWPEAVMAGAFDFAQGGPRQYPGGVSEAAWIGDGRARLNASDIKKAGILYFVANLLIILGLTIYSTPSLLG